MKAAPLLLAALLALSACGDEGSRTDENMGAPMSGDMASLMTAPPTGTPMPMPMTGGADAPVLPCTGLRLAASDTAEDAGEDAAGKKGALPDLTLDCLGDGAPIALRDLRGPLVLNVWASWCLPCADELPHLSAAHEALGAKVEFAAIALTDKDDSSRDWLSFHGVNWPSLSDGAGKIRGPLRIPGPPVTLFVRSDGTVAEVHYGAFTSASQVRDAIAEHLGVA